MSDMVSIQQKIVDEILQEYKDKKEVTAICVFGSVAVGKERHNSDVDIQIVYKDNREWELFKEKRYGIDIDFEVVTKRIHKMLIKKYPYLCYEVLKYHKILLDKEHFMSKIKNKLIKYYKQHPEIAEFWEKQYQQMRKDKNAGSKPKSFIKVCDEAETLFSKHKAVKRKILTDKFFDKHMH